ncbi:MAG: outer membrane protein transport protein [Alphaproteobacteria bacterium]|nr:outer membrane protein transport protein [Alphaproteobacteria bacterium]
MKKIIKLMAFAGAFMASFHAQAGGYQLNDYSVTGLGRSYAGQGIMGDDYSAIAYNPAGMTLMKQSGVQQNFSFINLKADVDGLGDYAGEHKKMNFWQPIPSGFAQYNVNDRLMLGLGIYAPFGLKTQYKANWFASDAAILSKLDIVDFNASTAYKVTDKWSVGISLIARYIYGRMTQTKQINYPGVPVPLNGEVNFNVHGWTQTGALGVMYEPTKDTRFGFSYRLRSAQRAKGHMKVYIPAAQKGMAGHVWANPDLPETFTFSAYHRYKKVGFSGTARWTHWTSSFPNFTVRSDIAEDAKTYYRYQNTWTLTGGVDYYYCKNLTLRFGGGWDESPTHKAERRTIRIPDNDRFWMSVGASYMKNNWQIDVGYAHMIARSGLALGKPTSDPNEIPVKYKNMQSHILGVQFQYKF